MPLYHLMHFVHVSRSWHDIYFMPLLVTWPGKIILCREQTTLFSSAVPVKVRVAPTSGCTKHIRASLEGWWAVNTPDPNQNRAGQCFSRPQSAQT